MIETEMTPREQLHIIVRESDRLKNIQFRKSNHV